MLKQITTTFFIVFALAGLCFGQSPNPTLSNLPNNTALDLGVYTCNQPSDNSTYCESITDFSGFRYDKTNHQMLMFGGGHSATFRTDVSVFSFSSLAWSSAYPSTPCSAMTLGNINTTNGSWISTGHPLARHTYDMLVPLDTELVMLTFNFDTGGVGNCTAATSGFGIQGRVAHYNPVSKTWSYATSAPGNWGYTSAAEYDPISGKIIIIGQTNQAGAVGLWTYDPVTKVSSSQYDFTARPPDYDGNLVYFPPNQKMYAIMRNGSVYEISLDRNNFANTTGTLLPVTGSPPPLTPHTGWAYDSVNQIIGGGIVNGVFYAFNPINRTWTSTTMQVSSGTPGTVAAHALDYDPVDHVFVYINDSRHTWAYHYAGGGSSAPGDTAAPSQPTNPTATAISSSQINLSWTASTDNVGVGGYKIYRSGALLTTVTGTTYQDNGLASSTTYSYIVAAYDAVGNTSGQSTVASATTQAVATPPPSTPPPTTGSADFQTRCAATGVIRCWGFETDSELTGKVWASAQGTGSIPVRDASKAASGSSSLKLPIPSDQTLLGYPCARTTPPNCPDNSGSWHSNLADDMSVQIGEGEEVYMQFRAYVPAYVLTYPYIGNDGTPTAAKFGMIGEGDQAQYGIDTTGSCSQFETPVITGNNLYGPAPYHGCGRFIFFGQWGVPGQQIAFQHQGPPYCLYPNDPNRACIKIAPDEWVTITTHIEVGTWNTPSSRIRTYYARAGQASTLIADSNDAYPNKTFEIDNTCGRSAACAAAGLADTGSGTWPHAKFGKVWLMSYMTGRDPNKNGGAAQASALWIDDLIVSRQPIADPGSGTTTQLQPPAAPTGLLLQ